MATADPATSLELKRPCKNSSQSTARKLAYVWARMASRYGALWATTHGDAPGQIDQGEWGEMLQPLCDDEIREGFGADLHRGSDYPPSSAKFSTLCRPPASPQSQLPAYQPHVSDRAHRIDIDASRACAKRHLDSLAAMLGVAS